MRWPLVCEVHKIRCMFRFQSTALAYGMTIPRSSAEIVWIDTMYIMLNNSIANIEKIKRLVEIRRLPARHLLLMTGCLPLGPGPS